MPYKSKAQAAYFNIHRSELEKQGVNVDEWNSASKGHKMPQYSKGDGGKPTSYAKGGSVLPRSQDWTKPDPQERGNFGQFLGTKDRFSDTVENARVQNARQSQETTENWTKSKGVGHTDRDDFGDSKSETPIKARKPGASIKGR